MTHAAEIGALVGVHAENNDVNKFLVNKFLEEGHVEPWYHYMSKDEAVAGEADVRAINLAKTRRQCGVGGGARSVAHCRGALGRLLPRSVGGSVRRACAGLRAAPAR